MHRRQLIKTSCRFCVLAASGILVSELASCSPAYQVIRTDVVNNEIRIPVLGFAPSGLLFIRPKGWYYDIAVQKKPNNSYEALLLQCTHQSNQLTPTGNGYTCNLHGSQFNPDGRVIKGPAEISLKKYPVAVENEILIIRIHQS